MNGLRRAGCWFAVAGFVLGVAGCSNEVMDPAQIGRFRPKPAVNLILDSLGVAEETPSAWAEAEEPQPRDIVAVRSDYALRSGDVVRISIFELLQEGASVINDYVVSETGKISIPEVGVVQAGGLTEAQLEEEIKQILSPSLQNVLKTPSVTVTLMNSQQRTFSILGDGVPQAGRYVIPRYDFRLTDALATAGGPMQFNVSTIYVSRREEKTAARLELETGGPGEPELELIEPQSSRRRAPNNRDRADSGRGGNGSSALEVPEPTQPAEPFETEREMLEMIAPSARNEWPGSDRLAENRAQEKIAAADITASILPNGFRRLTSSQMNREQTGRTRGQMPLVSPIVLAGDDEPNEARKPQGRSETTGRVEWVFRDGKWVAVPVEAGAEATTARPQPARDGKIEWVFRDGRWVPVEKGARGVTPPPAEAKPGAPTLPIADERLPTEREWEEAIQTRLLEIPADKLLAGDPRYNIVIKPGDTIHVPVDVVGEFCIMGNVNRSGYFNMTGRPMTLKMAIAAAGGLGPLAWPKYCEVVRRIGKRKEEIVMVDLDKIAKGEQPDFFIKPNDLINVGTHPTSRWRAVLRNAFRAAYGFGFVYDRNFVYADDYYGTSLF